MLLITFYLQDIIIYTDISASDACACMRCHTHESESSFQHMQRVGASSWDLKVALSDDGRLNSSRVSAMFTCVAIRISI